MKIQIVSMRDSAAEAMTRLHAQAQPALHQLVNDPEDADMLLLCGSWDDYATEVRTNPLVHRFPQKCFVYFDADGFVPILRGVYANAEKPRLFDSRRPIGMPLATPVERFAAALCFILTIGQCAFVGLYGDSLRKKLYKIDFARADVLVQNTSDYFHWDPTQAGREQRQMDYARLIAASHFGLCPRGASAGGLRLYEVMQMGVAPVLISDAWKLPAGPAWDRFLIQVKERDIRRLPEILEAHVGESAERGRLAREAWEQWFAPEVVFNHVISVCERAQAQGRIPERLVRACWGPMLWKRRMHKQMRGAAKWAVLRVFKLLRLRFIYDLNAP